MEIGPYRAGRELGRGGMGVVYEALDPGGRRVAVKVLLDPTLAGEEERERFRREAQACQRLSHPGLVPLVDVGTHQGRPYVVLAFLEGPTLASALETQGSFDVDDAVRLVADLAEALAYAHDHGVVHRDLKPENVILVAGRPVLTDFGLARLGNDMQRLTLTGEILGTPGYMAPEQADGDPDAIEGRTDVYALGATLYALLTGQSPHPPDGPLLSLLHRILSEDPRPVRELRPDTPPALADLCHRCLARDAQARPSARELADALRQLPEPEDPPSPLRWLAASAVGLLALLLLGVGVALLRSAPTPDAPPASPSPTGARSPAPRSTPGPRSTPAPSARALIERGQAGAARALLERVPAPERGARWWTLRGLLAEVEAELGNSARGRTRASEAYRAALERVTAGEALAPEHEAELLLAADRVDLDAGRRGERLERARRLAPGSSTAAVAAYQARRVEVEARLARAVQAASSAGAFRAALSAARDELDTTFSATRRADPPQDYLLRSQEIDHHCWVAELGLRMFGRYYEALRVRVEAEQIPVATARSISLDVLGSIDLDVDALLRARRACQAAIAAAPLDPRRHARLGRLRKLELEELLRGLEGLLKSARGNRPEVIPRLERRIAWLRGGRPFEAARRAFNEALRLEPRYEGVLHDRGWLQIVASKTAAGPERARLHAAAIDDYRLVVALDSNAARNHYLLGVVYGVARRLPQAIESFASATRLGVGYIPAWQRRAALCHELGDPTATHRLRADLDRALKTPRQLSPTKLAQLRELRSALR